MKRTFLHLGNVVCNACLTIARDDCAPVVKFAWNVAFASVNHPLC